MGIGHALRRLWRRDRALGTRGEAAIRDDLWIAARPERVFAALTDPADLARWWPRAASVEPRIGGTLSFTWATGGTLTTRFDVFDPPRAVAFPFAGEHVSLEVIPEGGGARFRVAHRCGPEEAIHVAQAWGFLKANLKACVEAGLDLRATDPSE